MSEHTPGPWEVIDGEVRDKHGRIIVENMPCQNHVDIANAELIARAPGMQAEIDRLTEENAKLRVGCISRESDGWHVCGVCCGCEELAENIDHADDCPLNDRKEP